MSAPIISVENLGKRYTLRHQGSAQGYTALRDVITNGVKRLFTRRPSTVSRATNEEFWALKDVALNVNQGEVVGIIGRNGAGKSTLLKILSRITEPTVGRVTLGGRIASLLEVGTGFHSELTGRENIYLNGAILGMTKAEIRRKFDDIVSFADVSRFLDTQVKYYSSGMHVRLAFAVAAHLDPEILVIDEVLAVGDAEFQKRCLGKMKDVARSGRTVLFVSHQLNAVSTLCTRCIRLTKGRLVDDGPPESVIAGYLTEHSSTNSSEWVRPSDQRGLQNPGFTPTRMRLVDDQMETLPSSNPADRKVGVLIEGEVESPNPLVTVGFTIYSQSGELLWWSLHTDTPPEQWPVLTKGSNRLLCWLPQHLLNEGSYRVELVAVVHFAEWICQPMVDSPSVSFEVQGGLSESPYWLHARPGELAPVLPFSRLAD